MSISTCETCKKLCDEDKDECEVCADCDVVVCKKHCVISDRERPLCLDCGTEEATRQMHADAPGVWPDWMPLPKKEALGHS